MKLLTLEEIEEIQNDTDKIGETYINVSEMMVGIKTMQSLIATARAYWELKEPSEEPVATSSYRGLGSEEYYQHQRELKEATQNGYEAAKREMADKPHLPTLKVIVEAMKEAQGIHTETAHSPEDIGRAIESLEKHLE